MSLQNLNVFRFLSIILIANFAAHSPRIHVEGRALEILAVNTTATPEQLNSSQIKSFTTDANPFKAENALKASDLHHTSTHATTTTESITEATTVVTDLNNPTTQESHRLAPSSSSNRSLYDELKATSLFPSFSSFETSSEFIKFENMKMLSNSEESKSDESSMETKFMKNDSGFKNNVTMEERHSIDEAVFDQQSVKYSSLNSKLINDTEKEANEEEEKIKTTALPIAVTTLKKGKYLDLIRRDNDNINASIPNAAEVWALAGMRDFQTRTSADNDETSSDAELLSGGLNNTAKNLLDWTEIAKMTNESMTPSSDDNYKDELTKTTVLNDISGDEDPATSENKDVGVFMSSQPSSTTLSTLKSLIEDNRIELENGNVEFESLNKTFAANSRIDSDVFSTSVEEREESAVELIDPFKKSDQNPMKESLRTDEVELKNDFVVTTESAEVFTTESDEMMETTTTDNYETTTSIVDSFTVIGEEEDGEDIFKRTITELPPLTTEQPSQTPITTTSAPQTTTVVNDKIQMELTQETTTEGPSPSVNEIPESTQRYNKTTKSIRVAATTTTTTTDVPVEKEAEPTVEDSEGLSSTLIPKYKSVSQTLATTQHYGVEVESTSSPTIEIFDDDKFKYSTLLPETTAATTKSFAVKSGDFEESTTKVVDSLNKESLDGEETGSGSLGIISITVGVAVVLIIAAVAYIIINGRNKQKFSQRCRPVGLDAYSLDNVSVYNSVRRKANALRLSKRSYGNSAFEDPSLQSNVLDYQSLQSFAMNKTSIQDEFKDIPQVSVRVDEMPENCEDKNRYANVVPLPETRVHLQRLNDEEKSEFINANYVKGPKDSTNYYIATQAPLENTVADFWRMIWEQNSKVIIMATDLTENGVERSAEYIPASVVLDNSQLYGDFQVTLKSREVKGKYAVSQLHLKNLKTNTWREIMHLWYSWPENGCPTDETSVINLLLEARSYLRTALPEQLDENSNAENNSNMNDKDKLSTLDKTKSLQRVQGPLTVHCSPGTGRTGTVIACDIILRMLETPPRQIDIPQIVYCVRRGRANAVRTRDQYEFIYHIANAYATKLTTAPTET